MMIRNIFITITMCALVTESTQNSHRLQRSADTCGVTKSQIGLIVHGQSFTRGSYPWIVALMRTESTPPQFFCAATLISKSFVISGNFSYSISCPEFIFALFQPRTAFSQSTRAKKCCLGMFLQFLERMTCSILMKLEGLRSRQKKSLFTTIGTQ